MERLFDFVSRNIPSNPSKGILGSIDLNLSFLQKSGVPLFGTKQKNISYKVFIIIYGLVVLVVHRLFYLAFEVIDLSQCWMNLNQLTQNMCLSLMHLCGILKLSMVFLRLSDVHKICLQFEFMSKKYVKSDEQISAFHLNEFENKLSFILYAGFVGGSSFIGIGLLYHNPEILENSFPYRARIPDYVPYIVKLIYIPFSVFIISLQVVGIDYLNVTFINLTRGQLQVLNIALDQLNESKVGQVTVNKLKHLNGIVEHHTLILDIRGQIESVFKYPMLVQFSASLLIFAVTGFQALVKSEVTDLFMIYVYVGNILAELFLYCWYGNEVSEQNGTLALRGYETTWYNFDTKFKRTLLMFLMNAQRPLFFTAGGYVNLSLVTFSRVLSKSYTYVAVLRQQYTN